MECALFNRGVVVRGIEPHASVGVIESNDVPNDPVVAVRAGTSEQAILAARELQVLKCHTVGIYELHRVASAGGVAAVKQGAPCGMAGIMVALDSNARVARADDQVRSHVVRTVIDANDVSGTKVVS